MKTKTYLLATLFTISHTLLPAEEIKNTQYVSNLLAKAPSTSDCKKNKADIPTAKCCERYCAPPIIEVKAGYFFFSHEKMRRIYNSSGYDIQLSASYPIYRWLQIYASGEYMQRHGRSLGGHQKSTLREAPASLGLQAIYKIQRSSYFYVTAGPKYFWVFTHNKSKYFDKHINQNGIGGFANAGFHFLPTKHFLIDVFGEYSYAKLHFHPSKKFVYGESAQVGGYTFGGGIGYAF